MSNKTQFIKISGLYPDYSHIIYEINPTGIDDMLEAAFYHGEGGGSMADVKVEFVEMTREEFEAIEEAD